MTSLSCNLIGPVLRDAARLSQRYPPIARSGVFGVSSWPIGWDTPFPLSVRFPLGEHAKWRCETPPPPTKGVSRRYLRIPYENKAKACDTPLCDTISKGYCAIWGGISHWAAKAAMSRLQDSKDSCRSCYLGDMTSHGWQGGGSSSRGESMITLERDIYIVWTLKSKAN